MGCCEAAVQPCGWLRAGLLATVCYAYATLLYATLRLGPCRGYGGGGGPWRSDSAPKGARVCAHARAGMRAPSKHRQAWCSAPLEPDLGLPRPPNTARQAGCSLLGLTYQPHTTIEWPCVAHNQHTQRLVAAVCSCRSGLQLATVLLYSYAYATLRYSTLRCHSSK